MVHWRTNRAGNPLYGGIVVRELNHLLGATEGDIHRPRITPALQIDRMWSHEFISSTRDYPLACTIQFCYQIEDFGVCSILTTEHYMEPRDWFLIQLLVHQNDMQINLHRLGVYQHAQSKHAYQPAQKYVSSLHVIQP